MPFELFPKDLAGAIIKAIAEDIRVNGTSIGGSPQVQAGYVDKNTLRVRLSWTEAEKIESAFDLTYTEAVRLTKLNQKGKLLCIQVIRISLSR